MNNADRRHQECTREDDSKRIIRESAEDCRIIQ